MRAAVVWLTKSITCNSNAARFHSWDEHERTTQNVVRFNICEFFFSAVVQACSLCVVFSFNFLFSLSLTWSRSHSHIMYVHVLVRASFNLSARYQTSFQHWKFSEWERTKRRKSQINSRFFTRWRRHSGALRDIKFIKGQFYIRSSSLHVHAIYRCEILTEFSLTYPSKAGTRVCFTKIKYI